MASDTNKNLDTNNSPDNMGGNHQRSTIYGNSKYILAPMVEGSEPAFRLLTRKYNTEWCFTPMWHSTNFVQNSGYQKETLNSLRQLEGCSDRPLTVQFCANKPEIFSECVSILSKTYPEVAVDLNLGCPQGIAKRGHYKCVFEIIYRYFY